MKIGPVRWPGSFNYVGSSARDYYPIFGKASRSGGITQACEKSRMKSLAANDELAQR